MSKSKSSVRHEGLATEKILFFPDLVTSTKTQPNTRLLLFLDTATRYTGYAFFELSEDKPPKGVLVSYGNFKGGNGPTGDRIKILTKKIGNIIMTVKPSTLVFEFPYFQGGSQKGVQASASGATLNLAYLCGKIDTMWDHYLACIVAANRSKGDIELTNIMAAFKFAVPLQYNEWNGQLPKRVTCARCEEHFGLKGKPNTVDNNWVDAIMMGKWYIERRLFLEVPKWSKNDRVDL